MKHALEEKGLNAMTVYEVQGRGEQRGLEFTHRAGKFRVDMLPKMKVELVVKDDRMDDALSAICSSARTGEVGDGKIFVTPVEMVIKVRTGKVEEDRPQELMQREGGGDKGTEGPTT